MPTYDFSPPPWDVGQIWEQFRFNLSTATGFSVISGLVIFLPLLWLVWSRRGAKAAMVFSLAGIPLLVSMGEFPSWVKIIVYVIVAWQGMRLYAKTTEGV